MTLKKMKSILFMLLGFIALVCGVAGTVLPVLPGGPFYLLAVYFFSKSSKRVDAWFKNTYIYKKYVVSFLEKKGMTMKEKIRINLIADFFILLSVLYVDILAVRIILIGLALYKHYYFIKKIKTIPPQSYQVEESQ
ncbi:YbaN family protein [Rossellomorea sp. LjRoot5]|uniref:YbaN family protein n=1 Tax=Rossellomorea sp. LjRoot5 TaxID=3342331 RepID=UPI003ECDBCEE